MCGKIYLVFLSNIEKNGGCSLISPLLLFFHGFFIIDFGQLPYITAIFLPFTLFALHFIFRIFLCNLEYHKDIFRVMTYNVNCQLFCKVESYWCFIFASAPVFLISNILVDIYGMQTINFRGIGLKSIPKYLMYNIANVPFYLLLANFYKIWFKEEYMSKSFLKKIIIKIWKVIIIFEYIITIIIFSMFLYAVSGLIKQISPGYFLTSYPCYIFTPYFCGNFLDLIIYSLISLIMFFSVFY